MDAKQKLKDIGFDVLLSLLGLSLEIPIMKTIFLSYMLSKTTVTLFGVIYFLAIIFCIWSVGMLFVIAIGFSYHLLYESVNRAKEQQTVPDDASHEKISRFKKTLARFRRNFPDRNTSFTDYIVRLVIALCWFIPLTDLLCAFDGWEDVISKLGFILMSCGFIILLMVYLVAGLFIETRSTSIVTLIESIIIVLAIFVASNYILYVFFQNAGYLEYTFSPDINMSTAYTRFVQFLFYTFDVAITYNSNTIVPVGITAQAVKIIEIIVFYGIVALDLSAIVPAFLEKRHLSGSDGSGTGEGFDDIDDIDASSDGNDEAEDEADQKII